MRQFPHFPTPRRARQTARVMLDYAAQVTRDATQITATHHERLRAAGFDDRGILQVTLIASWFNYRVADALDVISS